MPATTTKLLASLGLLILCAGIAFGGGYLFFNRGGYAPPATDKVVFSQAGSQDIPTNSAPEPLGTTLSGGLLLVDATHRNSFRESEVAVLLSRIASRGGEVEFLGNFRTTEEAARLPLFEESLRQADALLVILPRDAYTDAEADLVERFVRKGGRLLLVSDPTRSQQINSLAERFGVTFQPDYLFNQHENDLNFQHIFVREFQPEELTSGVNAVALYTAGSIQTSGAGIAFTDATTESSLHAPGGGLSPIAWGNSRNVLAVSDLTFMIPPHNSALDNDQLLSNIADFLTAGSRQFVIGDFPHFYPSGSGPGVDIIVGQPALLESGSALKNGLSEYGIAATLARSEDFGRDTVFLGLHEDALRVASYLQAAGVRVDDSLSGPFGEGLAPEGVAIAVLDPNRDRHVLIVLADTPETLGKTVERLLDGQYRQDLVNDFASISSFPTESK